MECDKNKTQDRVKYDQAQVDQYSIDGAPNGKFSFQFEGSQSLKDAVLLCTCTRVSERRFF